MAGLVPKGAEQNGTRDAVVPAVSWLGLGPAIHDWRCGNRQSHGWPIEACPWAGHDTGATGPAMLARMGLVRTIHPALEAQMAGTSPTMTEKEQPHQPRTLSCLNWNASSTAPAPGP